MRGYSISWGVPDFGDTVTRRCVGSSLRSAGSRLRVVAAPSGWGKTIAAAQYASASSRETLWIDALGERLNLARICATVVSACALGPEGRAPSSDDDHPSTSQAAASSLARLGRPTLVVIDDVALEVDDIAALAELQMRACAARAEFLVTTRSSVLQAAREVGAAPIGVDELRLTPWEASALAAFYEPNSGHSVDALDLAMCDGHIALFSLVRGSVAHGLEPTSDPRLEACVRRLVTEGLQEVEVRLLQHAAMVRRGRIEDLDAIAEGGHTPNLGDVAMRLPLLRLSARARDAHFNLHESAVDVLMQFVDFETDSWKRRALDWALAILEERGDTARAFELVCRLGSQEAKGAWLAGAWDSLLESVSPVQVEREIRSLPLHAVMGSSALVTLWARALFAAGDDDEALAKAKAAARLAEFEGQNDELASARVVWVDALCRMQRFDEAAQVVGTTLLGESEGARLAELVVAATVFVYLGRMQAAHRALKRANGLDLESLPQSQDRLRLRHMEAVVAALLSGEYARLASQVSVLLPLAEAWESDRLMLRGNLALALFEMGRLDRARPLLTGVARDGSPSIRSLYMVVRGCCLAADGLVDAGTCEAVEGLELSYQVGLEADAAGNRTYVSVLLRACGDAQGSLTQAERAFERLSSVNYLGLRPLAALEIAASLLALNDVAAARHWVGTVSAEGFGGNSYHALRAAMILAECDRRAGDFDASVARFGGLKDHILSESSNWQMAMYVRAFPALLGIMSMAVGVDALPVHMLRMILPEHAEAALRICRPWLGTDEWKRLGQRALGDATFVRMERRGGQPVCHVRLFGGLDVTLADRTLAERDWRKRKARLLFAMLVARRGQDVPREQALDYLWPNLPEDRARNNFYVAWSSMKAALMGSSNRREACPYLENKGGRLRIVLDAVRSDIDEFEDTLAEARKADAEGDSDRALDAFARLSSVYRGDLLPGDVYDDWFAPLRDRCRFDFVDAMLSAVDILLERDDPCEALVYARRAQQVDPNREDLYQAVMRCSIEAGQRSSAIDAFLQLKTRLADDLGLDPSAESMDLYQQILVMEDRPRYDNYGLS